LRKFLVIKIIIAFVILFFLIRFINYDEIISAFRKADFLLLLIGVLLFIPNIMMQLLKWRFLLNLGNPSIKTPEVIKSFFAGFSVGMVTPGRVGEISRAFFIRGSDRIKILGYTIIDRVYSLLVTILFGLLSVAYLLVFNFKFSIFLLIPILVITFFFLIVVLYFAINPELFRSFVYNINIILPKREKIKRFLSLFDEFTRGKALIVFIYSSVTFFIYITQFYIFVNAFQRISIFPGYLSSIATIFTKSLIPVSVGDLGVREGASIFFFSRFSINSSSAFDSSILLFSVNVFLPAVIGFGIIIFSILTDKRNKN